MTTTAIQTHYNSPDLMTRIEQGLQAMGKERHSITLDDLAPVDEFHVRGAAVTADLIQLLAPTAKMHILGFASALGAGISHHVPSTASELCRATSPTRRHSLCKTYIGNFQTI